jgi:hypothetical protein
LRGNDEEKAAAKAKLDADTLAERQAKAADLKAQLAALDVPEGE